MPSPLISHETAPVSTGIPVAGTCRVRF
jgi:hypothetical protein